MKFNPDRRYNIHFRKYKHSAGKQYHVMAISDKETNRAHVLRWWGKPTNIGRSKETPMMCMDSKWSGRVMRNVGDEHNRRINHEYELNFETDNACDTPEEFGKYLHYLKHNVGVKEKMLNFLKETYMEGESEHEPFSEEVEDEPMPPRDPWANAPAHYAMW